ncbi:MAG: zinc ribbon domain-containing protein [Anaerolineae bacterium]|jgi:hypothetical protein|nr:zinc ribbon domain-containing protein [Anaerolineae bacterium]
MNTKVYHGSITPSHFAQRLLSYFNRGNYRVQQIGNQNEVSVQIATAQQQLSGGATAMTISLKAVEDGVSVSLGQQAWYGIAASLGITALSALRNPFSLLGRLDDLAQDIESIQLSDQIWKVLDNTAKNHGATMELSERLRRIVCSYCLAANPVGESNCLACGAPLGDLQPTTCSHCGYVKSPKDKFCPNCGK